MSQYMHNLLKTNVVQLSIINGVIYRNCLERSLIYQFIFNLQNFMKQQSEKKPKFYKLSPQQERELRINDIKYKLKGQQQQIIQLLNKYNVPKPDQQQYSHQNSPKIKISYKISDKRSSPIVSDPYQKQSIELPKIYLMKSKDKKVSYQSQRKNRSVLEKHKTIDRKIQLNKQIIHKSERPHAGKYKTLDFDDINSRKNTINRSAIRSPIKSPKRDRNYQQLADLAKLQKVFHSQALSNFQNLQSKEKQQVLGIPKPISYQPNIKNDSQSQDSSTQEHEVPVAYYERQLKEKIMQQCLEEVNFLYFSKNSTIKQWSQGIISIFQKHDKQINTIKKKCKFLQKFDEAYFTSDIYRDR